MIYTEVDFEGAVSCFSFVLIVKIEKLLVLVVHKRKEKHKKTTLEMNMTFPHFIMIPTQLNTP